MKYRIRRVEVGGRNVILAAGLEENLLLFDLLEKIILTLPLPVLSWTR